MTRLLGKSRVWGRGYTTIPVTVRRLLGIRDGDGIELCLADGGEVLVGKQEKVGEVAKAEAKVVNYDRLKLGAWAFIKKFDSRLGFSAGDARACLSALVDMVTLKLGVDHITAFAELLKHAEEVYRSRGYAGIVDDCRVATSLRNAYRLFGEAVPVPLAKAIARTIGGELLLGG